MNTYAPIDNIVRLPTAPRTDPDLTVQLELFRAGDPQQPAFSAPAQLRLFEPPASDRRQELATRLATAPGLVRAGAGRWDGGRTPIHPLSMESAYADPQLLRDLGARGARYARDLGVDVVVGAETAGVPLAASVSLDMREVADTVTSVAAGLPTESVATYLQVLSLATASGVLDPAVHELSVDAVVNHWSEHDPRWDLLPMAA